MAIIHVSDFISSGLNKDFHSIRTIEMEDVHFDSGAFGKVYHCHLVNGKTVQPQVIKILEGDNGIVEKGYNTIVSLQEQIIAHNTTSSRKTEKRIEEIPALYALPQFSFSGVLNGQQVRGYAANFLDQNYRQFSQFFESGGPEDPAKLRKFFYAQPLDIRIKMAYDLVEGCKMLQSLSFIHADLNPRNFFVNLQTASLCIIDYDGGAVIKTKDDHASTFGKMGEWLAPEIQRQLMQPGDGNIQVDLNTDSWSVVIGIHFLFFPQHPFFFLGTLGLKQVSEYFTHNRWPALQYDTANCTEQAKKFHEKYIQKLDKDFPLPIRRGFEETFNNGFHNPGRRLTYAHWLNLFKPLIKAPAIERFTVDLPYVIRGVPITLNWRVSNAHTIVINNGIGNVTGKNAITVVPEQDESYTLTAIGVSERKEASVQVTVMPVPDITALKVPVPEIQLHCIIDHSHIPAPTENLSINTATMTLPDATDAFLGIRQLAANHKDTINYSNHNLSAVFNSIKEKLNNI